MSKWNIRILHSNYPGGEHKFFPAEVYYSDQEAIVPNGYGNHSLEAESIEDMRFYTEEILKALDRPILEAGDAFPMVYIPT